MLSILYAPKVMYHNIKNRLKQDIYIRVGLDLIIEKMYYRVTMKKYVVKGMTEWIEGWIRNKWRNSQKKELLARDLWERLLQASKPHKIEWVWIKGHNGHPENDRCDQLAREEIIGCKKRLADETT